MKVFIAWSAERSGEVASALHDWLPSVIQTLRPYMSTEDVDKGARWSTELAKELEESNFGILSVTPENIDSAWLNFEAGALSKAFEASRVSPFLFGLKRSDISGPITQFQATLFEKRDVRRLVESLNTACGDDALDPGRLKEIFEVWWPRLQERLAAVLEALQQDRSKSPSRRPGDRNSAEVLEELVELVRSQQRLLSSPEILLPQDYLTMALRGENLRGHPAWDDLALGWSRTRRLIGSGPPTPERWDELQEVLRQLGDPVEYLLNRNVGVRPRRRPGPPIPRASDGE